jgi:molecular chaperone GrpE
MIKDIKKKKPVENLRKQAEEYLEGWKRCKADFENYKKQQQDWAAGFRLYATQEILEEIIPVIDNFELAVNHIPQTPENKNWLEGITHIKKQLEDILAAHAVTAITARPGDVFDPNIHECVQRPAEEECAATNNESFIFQVAEVIRPGYKIGDKLLRPAQVTLKSPNEK